ncbi:DNA-binding transcriptional LysR family regulator [Pseudomonas fluorescens]
MFIMQYISEIDELSHYPSIDTEVLRTFVAIADQGGFTRAGELVNRTQSAVSMQMKRLEEDVLQRQLFQRDGRQVKLTAEGQVLLGYARRILKLHSEVFNTLREPHMVGTVRIGTPDDYVMRFLPGILSRFAQAYPLIQIEVHCESSKQLLLRQDLDLSIVTREPGSEIGQLLRKERFVWAQAQCFSPNEQTPLPLAMFNSDCFCRLWACNALDASGREYRIAYNSSSLSAIMAVVSAGLAVTAQLESLITQDMRILGEAEGLPLLPEASIMLVRNLNNPSPITECLAEHIVEGFKL